MKKYILPLLLLSGSANALDIKYGQGDFEWKVGVANIMETSIVLDDTVISIGEQHKNFTDSRWYYFGNIDIHSSDTLNEITDVADYIVDLFPKSPESFGPFPSSFELSGVDLDVGIGYDLVQNTQGYLGIGVLTGISTPFMEMHNYIEAAEYISDMLEETSTDVKTYKLGIALQAAYSFTFDLSLYGSAMYAIQTGEMSNDIIDGTFDVDGTYSSIDVGFKYYLTDLSESTSNLYLKAGYTHKHWEIDEIKMSLYDLPMFEVNTLIDMEMDSDYFYAGIGYNF